MDLNYSCVCVRTCACSTQQEIWDMSSLGACPCLLFAGKPGQSWRGPSSTAPAPPSPWNSDACWQGHLQARVAAGLWLQLTHIVGHFTSLPLTEDPPARQRGQSPWRRLPACLGNGRVLFILSGKPGLEQ